MPHPGMKFFSFCGKRVFEEDIWDSRLAGNQKERK